jgi:hypothetical protein
MLELRYPAMGVSIIVGSGFKSFHVSEDCSKSIISEVVVYPSSEMPAATNSFKSVKFYSSII